MAAKYSPTVLYCRGSSSARSANVVAQTDRTYAHTCMCVGAREADAMEAETRGRRISYGRVVTRVEYHRVGELLCVR